MKSFFKERWKFVLMACFIVIGLVFTTIIILKDGKEEEKIKIAKDYVMYVSINPQVKLTFTEVYYECTDDSGKKDICGGIEDSVKSYELLNDDALDFYHALDFKNKSYREVLIMLCDIARDNKVAFDKIEVVTDSVNVSREDILKSIKENSKYETNFDILLDVEERINEDEVLDEFDREKVYYTVKFDSKGGSKIDDRIAEENTSLAELQKPTKEGYTFVNWEYDDKTFDETTIITKDITVSAVWKKEEVKTTKKTEDDEKTTTTTKAKEETISITLEKSVKNYKFKKTNLYEDSKKRLSAEALYGCENVIKIKVTGPKSKVESITAKNIELGVDFKGITTAGAVEKEIYVTNKKDGVEYSVLNPKINARMEVYKKVESTIDKINLNENLLVTEDSVSSSWCGGTYVTTNFKDVFKDYLKGDTGLYVSDTCDDAYDRCIKFDEFSELSKQLIIDTTKLNKIVADFEKVKNTKYKNVKDFSFNYDLNKGTISYRYDTLSIADYYIDSLPETMHKYVPKLLDAYSGIYTTYGPCGMGPGEEVLLNETLCKEYNLTCSRW